MNFIKKLLGERKDSLPDGYDFILVKDEVQTTTIQSPDGSESTETGGYRLIPQTYSALSWCDHNNIFSNMVMVDGVFLTRGQLPGLLRLLSEEELTVFEVKS
jgi:hypothetical protein